MTDMRSLRDEAQATRSIRFRDPVSRSPEGTGIKGIKSAAIPIVLMGAKIHFPETTLGALKFFVG